MTPAPSAAVSATPSSTQTALSILVEEWKGTASKMANHIGHFALKPDGTYTIEARFDNPDAPLASSHVTYFD